MERKIGEIFEDNGDWYQCVEQNGCGACPFRKNDTICHSLGCSELVVKDSKPVIFKKLEKAGEPYMSDGHLMQTLSGYTQPIYFQTKGRECYFSGCYLRVEIEQNQRSQKKIILLQGLSIIM